jgi:hypothetical protein|tara:strand:+ start:2554 stop:3000 length:447 start_codon:yes stop_codon:yes gene_type:complete
MQYDEIIDCPKSGGDLCYKIEVSPEVTNFYSLSCGFWTNSLMKVGEEFYNQQLELLPEIYKDLAWLDPKTELIWLPHSINDPQIGMVYASGTNSDDWRWAAVKAKELDEEVTHKDGSISSYKPDMSTIAYFNERDYMDALSYIGLLPG